MTKGREQPTLFLVPFLNHPPSTAALLPLFLALSAPYSERQGGCNSQPFTGYRVRKAQAPGMEQKIAFPRLNSARQGLTSRAVKFLTQKGTTFNRKMDANLVGTSCFQKCHH